MIRKHACALAGSDDLRIGYDGLVPTYSPVERPYNSSAKRLE